MTIKDGLTASAGDVIESIGNLTAQNTNRILKSDTSVFVNEQYSGADDFTDSNGVMNTVDTGNTTSLYNSDLDAFLLPVGSGLASGDTTANDGFTNPENAFDANDGTYARYTATNTTNPLIKTLGKTFTSQYIARVDYKIAMTNELANGACIIQSYNGSTWDDDATITSTNGVFTGSAWINKSVEGIRIKYVYTHSTLTYKTWDIYTLEYVAYTSPGTVETNSIISDVVPDSIVVYGETSLPTGSSITVDVSDNGGSTFGITAQSLNTAIDTSSFSTGNLALRFNLATTDLAEIPKLYGYGVAITDK